VKRLDHTVSHRWHVALNQMDGHESWMYEAKSMADEVPRLAILFGMERTGTLAKVHRQCSRSSEEPVHDNHLTCCLGKKCAECPFLAAIEKAEICDDDKDVAKAWTCACHIVSSGGDVSNEGYVMTVDDRMYWGNVYDSLTSGYEE